MRTTVLGGAIAAALALAAPAGAVTINFDSLPGASTVTNQFAEATFSAPFGGVTVFTSASFFGTSAPNFICSSSCVVDIDIAFTDPVNNLNFLALGDNDAGTTALVDVFDGSGLLATVNVVTDGVVNLPHMVDLSAFANVTAIKIRDITDSAGLGFDDFNFDVGNNVATPEPASMALFGLGLLGLSAARRRR
jgi:hypothetical protein